MTDLEAATIDRRIRKTFNSAFIIDECRTIIMYYVCVKLRFAI